MKIIYYPLIIFLLILLMIFFPKFNNIIFPNIFDIHKHSNISEIKAIGKQINVTFNLGKYIQRFKVEKDDKNKNQIKLIIKDLLNLKEIPKDEEINKLEKEIYYDIKENYNFVKTIIIGFFIILFFIHIKNKNEYLSTYYEKILDINGTNSITIELFYLIIFILYNIAFRIDKNSYDAVILVIVAYISYTILFYFLIQFNKLENNESLYKVLNDEDKAIKEKYLKNIVDRFIIILLIKSLLFCIIYKSNMFGIFSCINYLLVMYNLNNEHNIYSFFPLFNQNKLMQSLLLSSFILVASYLMFGLFNFSYNFILNFKFGILIFGYILFHLVLSNIFVDKSKIFATRNKTFIIICIISQLLFIFISKILNNKHIFGISWAYLIFWIFFMGLNLILYVEYKNPRSNTIIRKIKFVYIIVSLTLGSNFIGNNLFSYIINN